MKCSFCGTDLRPGSQFCNSCGKWQPLKKRPMSVTLGKTEQKEETSSSKSEGKEETVSGNPDKSTISESIKQREAKVYSTKQRDKSEEQNNNPGKTRIGIGTILLIVLLLLLLVFCLFSLLGREDRMARPHAMDSLSVDTIGQKSDLAMEQLPEYTHLEETGIFLEQTGSLKTFTNMSFNIDLPEKIEGISTEKLQLKIINILFRDAKETNDVKEALNQWKNNLGEPMEHMPDMKGQRRIGDTLTWKAHKELKPQGYIRGRFISFTYQDYRLCDQEQPKYDDYPVYALNYDLENDKELMLSELLTDEGIKALFGVEKEALDARRRNASPRTVLFTPTEIVFLKGKNADEKITVPIVDAVSYLTPRARDLFIH